jgi:antitoxin (DNA-binding transcriptional repressor) of toxin-antitoxin stability system
MKTYSVAEAKAKFSEVLELAASGEEVLVTKHGKPYVWLLVNHESQPAEPQRLQKIDWDKLKHLRDSLPQLDISATTLVRQIRDDSH